MAGHTRLDVLETSTFHDSAVVPYVGLHHRRPQEYSRHGAAQNCFRRLEINDETPPVWLGYSVHLLESALLKIAWQVVNRKLAYDQVESLFGKGDGFGQTHLEINIDAHVESLALCNRDHLR